MPTGYTCDVQSGAVTEFSEFAMNCSRAFGLAEVDSTSEGYHSKAIEENTKKLSGLHKMTNTECNNAALTAYAVAVAIAQKQKLRKEIEKERYLAMLAKVKAWTPTTKDHSNLQEFMIAQLTSSIKFDCSDCELPAPRQMTATEWFNHELEKCEDEIMYHTKEYAKELSNDAWLRNLRLSLTKK